jgi:hypothetical protein
VLASIQPSSGIVVARDHPLAGRKSIRLAECANYSFVFPDSSLTSRRILETALERAKVHFAGVVTTNSVEVMKMLVREHRQIALLSLPDIGADFADRDLVHIPLADRHVRGLAFVADRTAPRQALAGRVHAGGIPAGRIAGPAGAPRLDREPARSRRDKGGARSHLKRWLADRTKKPHTPSRN